MKISDMKPGRRDGGYTRLFGNDELGALFSQSHAASISNGNELGRMIEKAVSPDRHIDDKNFNLFASASLAPGSGPYLISRAVIDAFLMPHVQAKHARKKSKKVTIKNQTDFIVVYPPKPETDDQPGEGGHLDLVELKDGDHFDTKKAHSETEALKNTMSYLAEVLPYTVDYRVCMFNASNVEAVIKGFRNRIETTNAWTGQDLCKVLGLDHATLVRERVAGDQADNFRYFISQMTGIPQVREFILKKLAADGHLAAAREMSHVWGAALPLDAMSCEGGTPHEEGTLPAVKSPTHAAPSGESSDAYSSCEEAAPQGGAISLRVLPTRRRP